MIRFLFTEVNRTTESHCQLVEVYGKDFTRQNVTKWEGRKEEQRMSIGVCVPFCCQCRSARPIHLLTGAIVKVSMFD